MSQPKNNLAASADRLKVGSYALNIEKAERKLVVGYIARQDEVTFSWSTKWESAKGWVDDGTSPIRPPFSYSAIDPDLALRIAGSGERPGSCANSHPRANT